MEQSGWRIELFLPARYSQAHRYSHVDIVLKTVCELYARSSFPCLLVKHPLAAFTGALLAARAWPGEHTLCRLV